MRGGTAGDVLLIWVAWERKYFWKPGWTAEITLIRLNKTAFCVKRRSHSPDGEAIFGNKHRAAPGFRAAHPGYIRSFRGSLALTA